MRVLIVEDEPKLARTLERGLRRYGYAVDLAGTGDEGLFNARVYDYDAVVLDVMLPGAADGFDVCRTLRDEGRWAPVLMLTARDQVDDRIRGLDAGADDYLVKPFAFRELLARLRALMRRGGPERPALLEVGELVVDPARHRVARAGRPIELTPREFALIEFLARSSDRVVSRTELIEHVWDRNFSGSSNVVDVYVGYLRRKLGDGVIRTVRGVGYTLES
jgi:two-component system OmpR family response regulator